MKQNDADSLSTNMITIFVVVKCALLHGLHLNKFCKIMRAITASLVFQLKWELLV